MKKKMLIAAAVAAMTASGGAWAACTADIDMGNNSIQNLAAPTNDSDAATKAYVDAVGRLEISPVTNLKVRGFLGGVQFCQDLNDAGNAVDGVADYAGWRLPQTLGEASLGFDRHTQTIDISSQAYAISGGTNIVSGAFVWVAMAASDGNQPPDQSWTTDGIDDTRWMMARLDGIRWGYNRSDSEGVFAFCVR